VAERKPFLLRIDPAVLEALQRWADDELRSLNGQIEYVLRDALRASGRLKPGGAAGDRPGADRRRH
jgi:hypothetical protein